MSGRTRIAVFCGARDGTRPEHLAAARTFGADAAKAQLGIVYGGASIGMMGALADGALKGGGEVIGVIPQFMVDKELAHRGLTRLEVVKTMSERKELIASLADAFVALPGGFGTLDELFEMLTASYLGFHTKPVGLLNSGGFFDPLYAWMETAAESGFVSESQVDAVHLIAEPSRLINELLADLA
jgi:uncharacterized protein (TIGR00730 family)